MVLIPFIGSGGGAGVHSELWVLQAGIVRSFIIFGVDVHPVRTVLRVDGSGLIGFI